MERKIAQAHWGSPRISLELEDVIMLILHTGTQINLRQNSISTVEKVKVKFQINKYK